MIRATIRMCSASFGTVLVCPACSVMCLRCREACLPVAMDTRASRSSKYQPRLQNEHKLEFKQAVCSVMNRQIINIDNDNCHSWLYSPQLCQLNSPAVNQFTTSLSSHRMANIPFTINTCEF